MKLIIYLAILIALSIGVRARQVEIIYFDDCGKVIGDTTFSLNNWDAKKWVWLSDTIFLGQLDVLWYRQDYLMKTQERLLKENHYLLIEHQTTIDSLKRELNSKSIVASDFIKLGSILIVMFLIAWGSLKIVKSLWKN